MGALRYGLAWIDEGVLRAVTQHTFGNALQTKKRQAPPDPFTLVAQSVITNSSLDSAIGFEAERAINKTLSNEIGLWHQRVLGLAEGWHDLGASGGGVDLRSDRIDARFGKTLVAEVKNRYNTIKSSDEKKVWDQLDLDARSTDSVAYVFQIVPKDHARYDRPWKVSGRSERDHVRCCDGATAYEMVFGREDALQELYEAFPALLRDALGLTAQPDADRALELFFESFPSSPKED